MDIAKIAEDLVIKLGVGHAKAKLVLPPSAVQTPLDCLLHYFLHFSLTQTVSVHKTPATEAPSAYIFSHSVSFTL